jgi:hypothetical protein
MSGLPFAARSIPKSPFDHKIHLQTRISQKFPPRCIFPCQNTDFTGILLYRYYRRIPEKTPHAIGELFFKKQDLLGIVLPEGQSPAVIFLPPSDLSHIPGSLDLVAPLAEDLKIIPGPLIAPHGDWPDVIQNVVMTIIRRSGGGAFMDLLVAPGTLPFLLKPDKSPHFGNSGPLFAPVLPAAGGLAADGILVF